MFEDIHGGLGFCHALWRLEDEQLRYKLDVCILRAMIRQQHPGGLNFALSCEPNRSPAQER
jgi:hypothetical protein